MANRDGGPAFPIVESVECESGNRDMDCMARGLSKREWFAGQVLQGLLADTEFNVGPEEAATTAVRYADALLKELSKE